MNNHHVIFFPDEHQEHGTDVKKALKEKYSCFTSTNLDEYDQVYRQSGKFVMLFLDVKKAIGFMQVHASELKGLEFKTIVYLNKNGKFNPESQKVLDTHRVIPFQKDEVAKMLKTIEDFFTSGSDALNIDDIQFIMPKDE